MKRTIIILTIFLLSIVTLKTKAKEINPDESPDVIYYSEEELTRMTLLQNTLRIYNNNSINISKSIINDELDKIDYLLVGSKNDYPYIERVITNTVKYTLEITTFGKGEVVNGLYDGDDVIVLVNSLSKINVLTYSLLRINVDGEILNSYTFDANYKTKAYGINKYKDLFYVVGESMATNILNNQNTQNVGIIFVSTFSQSFIQIKTNIFGNLNGINELIDFVFIDSKTIIQARFNGTGSFKALKALVVINGNLYIDKIHYIDDGIYSLHVFFDKVGLVKVIDDTDIELSVLSLMLATEKSISLNVAKSQEKITNVTSNKLNIDNHDFFAMVFDIPTNKRTYIVLLNESGDVIINDYYQSTYYTDNIFTYKNNIYSFSNLNKKIEYFNYIYILRLIDDELECNGIKYKMDDNQYIDYYFGYYLVDVSYTLDYAIIKTNLKRYVPLVVSVKDNCIYDINHVLTFNGDGRLNNKDIESGYVIEDEGEYVLVITGKVGDQVMISFTVRKECVDLDRETEEIVTPKISKNKIKETEDKKETLSYSNIIESSNRETNASNNVDSFIYYIISFVIGIVLGIVIPKIRMKKVKKC